MVYPLVIDVASAPLPDAANYLDPPRAPSNWKDPVKIDAYVAEKTADRLGNAALDPDLARLTAIGILDSGAGGFDVYVIKDEAEERKALGEVGQLLQADFGTPRVTITYNGLKFDLPLLMRRARYLGVPFPRLNLDKYRSPHIDLAVELSDHDPERRRSLAFYIKRLGWTDLAKALSGEEESRVHDTGRWDELTRSVEHDLMAAYRLAIWMNVIRVADAV